MEMGTWFQTRAVFFGSVGVRLRGLGQLQISYKRGDEKIIHRGSKCVPSGSYLLTFVTLVTAPVN